MCFFILKETIYVEYPEVDLLSIISIVRNDCFVFIFLVKIYLKFMTLQLCPFISFNYQFLVVALIQKPII